MTDPNNVQRRGAISNAHAGRELEESARLFFEKTGIPLDAAFSACPVRRHNAGS